MALNTEELAQIKAAYEASSASLMVGFNRRFSPHAEKMKSLLDTAAPKNIIATMNAGFIPPAVWVHDMEVGGGRIVGEACHFMDLMVYLTGSTIVSVCMSALGTTPSENTDNAIITLRFANGDQGVINYFSNGNKAYAKERLEVYSQGKTLIMDNFRELTGYGFKGFTRLKTRLDKGHQKQFALLTAAAREGNFSLIPFNELENTALASLAAIESLKTNAWVAVE